VMSLGVAAVLVHQIARRLFGQTTALVALALMLVVLVPLELAWVPRTLLSESLYFFLMPAAILALLSLVDHVRSFRRGGLEPQDRIVSRPPYQLALLVGALLGLACLARNPTFAYLLPAGVLVWYALRRRGLPRVPTAGTLAAVGVGAALVIAPVPLRNAVVAGKPAILASNGGAALEIYHRPSPAVRLSKIDADPLYQWLKVDRPTREVIEYVRQDPGGYFSSWLPLAAYALGIGSAMNHLLDVPPIQLRPHLLVLNALYVLAMFMVARARRPESGLLHAFIGIHLLCMVVFMPYSYENRPVLPMYLFVTVFAAAALVEIWRRALLTRSARAASQVRHRLFVGRSTLTRAGPN
jgi:4-amino-4-deoxy-L-arabinose transferase-like glycosyltransferase